MTGSLSIGTTRAIFDELFKAVQAHPWVLRLLGTKYDGYHHVAAQDGFAQTFYFGAFHSALIWTFSPATVFTKVLLISHREASYDEFDALLNVYRSHLCTAHVPLMALVLNGMLSQDSQLDYYANEILFVEKGTGFSWNGTTAEDLRFHVDDLSNWSRTSASAEINIINLMRHYENCMKALEVVGNTTDEWLDDLDEEYRDRARRSMQSISESIKVLRTKAEVFVSYGTYIRSRAQAQISVIFALLTHEDSSSNLKAAEASTAVAEATKRDSSAMKTIAFMTMAFLPATFLAAFFAIPVLEWESKTNVSMNGFQLYWIITVPATLVVFLLWAVITQWGSNLKALLREKRRKTHNSKIE